MSAPMVTLQLTMKDKFKTFAPKTIILQEDQRIHSILRRVGGRYKKQRYTIWKNFYYTTINFT